MEQEAPLEGEVTSIPQESPPVEIEKKKRFSFSFSGGSRFGKRGLFALLGLTVFGAGIYAVLCTPLPLQLAASRLASEGFSVQDIQGSSIEDWKAASVEIGSEQDGLIRLQNLRFEMDLWSLLGTQQLKISALNVENAEIYFPRRPSAAAASGSPQLQSFSLHLNYPVVIQDASVATGIFYHPAGNAKFHDSAIQTLTFKPETKSVHAKTILITSDLGTLHIESADLTEEDFNLQGLKAQLQPGLLPEFLKSPTDVQGHIRLVTSSQGGQNQAQLNILSEKISLRTESGKFLVKLKDVDLPKNFVFDFPLLIEEADLEVPRFSWNDAASWKEQFIHQVPKMKVRFGETPLRFDESCQCLRDEEFSLGLIFQSHPQEPKLGLKMIVNEYRPEPSFSSDEELLAETGWGKSTAFLPESARDQIRKIIPLIEVHRPPALPETNANLLNDIRYLGGVQKDPEALATLSIIKKSARESAPLPVLYFASLLASGNRECENVPTWISEITAKSQDPMLLGKSFAILSQCEEEPLKQKQLAEMAKMYLPKDPYIDALLHRIRAEHFPTQKTDEQAILFLKNKKTDKELSLMIIEGFLKRVARAKSLTGTLKWAQEKYKISQDERDLNLVNRLKSIPASNAPAGRSSLRRPASKP